MRKLDLPLTARRVKIGVWSCQENKIYLEFLRKNKNDFASEVARRSSKVFYYLSKALKKRTPDQCRSHHQKLQMRISNIEDIIAYVERKSLGYPRVPKRDKKTSHPEQTHEGPIHSWCVPTYDKICLKLAINFESLNYL